MQIDEHDLELRVGDINPVELNDRVALSNVIEVEYPKGIPIEEPDGSEIDVVGRIDFEGMHYVRSVGDSNKAYVSGKVTFQGEKGSYLLMNQDKLGDRLQGVRKKGDEDPNSIFFVTVSAHQLTSIYSDSQPMLK